MSTELSPAAMPQTQETTMIDPRITRLEEKADHIDEVLATVKEHMFPILQYLEDSERSDYENRPRHQRRNHIYGHVKKLKAAWCRFEPMQPLGGWPVG
jgi:hypothetical protein